jgi:hypothetical protein
MWTRTIWRRGVLPVTCLALLTVGTQVGQPQPPPGPAGSPPGAPLGPPVQPVSVPSLDPPAVQAVPPLAAAPPTVEDLIRQIEHIRQQKADLDRQEKALAVKLQALLKDQADRLHKLGLPVPPPPDSKDPKTDDPSAPQPDKTSPQPDKTSRPSEKTTRPQPDKPHDIDILTPPKK